MRTTGRTETIARISGPIAWNGRRARFMLPANRRGAWITKVFNGRTVECVTSNPDDACAEDARAHPGHPEAIPPRALLVFDQDKTDTRALGVAARMAFDFVLYPMGGPKPPISADYLVIAEYNAWPGPGAAWGPPPLSLDLHFDRTTGRESLFATVWGMNGTRALPITRGAPHHVEVEYVFSAGGPGGRARVLLDGQVLANHVGPTGKPGFTGVFAAFGVYGTPWRPRKEGIAINFEHFRESAA